MSDELVERLTHINRFLEQVFGEATRLSDILLLSGLSPAGTATDDKNPQWHNGVPGSVSTSATTYDGKTLAEERAVMDLAEFASRFEKVTGRPLSRLASRGRSKRAIMGRIEFVALALPRYGFRGCDVAALLDEHCNSVTLWLGEALRLQRCDPEFKCRLDQLDEAISRRG